MDKVNGEPCGPDPRRESPSAESARGGLGSLLEGVGFRALSWVRPPGGNSGIVGVYRDPNKIRLPVSLVVSFSGWGPDLSFKVVMLKTTRLRFQAYGVLPFYTVPSDTKFMSKFDVLLSQLFFSRWACREEAGSCPWHCVLWDLK